MRNKNISEILVRSKVYLRPYQISTRELSCKYSWRVKAVDYCHKSRNSRWRCSIKKGVLKNFAKFAGKHLCHSLFFNKLAGFRPGIFLKKRLWHKCIPVNFRKFLWTPFLQNTFGRLSIVIRELQTVFWKLRLEITNFLENCVSSFFDD